MASTSTKTISNGISSHQSDKAAAIDYLKALKRGEKAIQPTFSDADITSQVEEAERLVALASGDLKTVERIYRGLGMAGKYPLFAELLAEEQEVVSPEMPLSTCAPLPASAMIPEEAGTWASTWLDEYIAFSRQWSPRAYDDFHEAVGLWVLSTVAARRVSLPHGGKRYTPLFIALCARTSLYSKSTTADIGLAVLSQAGLDWMLAPDEATPQRFIQSLAGRLPADYGTFSPDLQERGRQQLALSGQKGWFYEEFGQHLAAMARENGTMADFKGIIRRLDDCKEKYSRETISRGTETIYSPYVALLVGMTPADIRPYTRAGGTMWHDGFWARFAFVAPSTDIPKLDRFPPGYRIIPPALTLPLRAWHERLGMPEVTISEGEAGAFTWQRGRLPESWMSWTEEAYEAYYTYDIALKSLLAGPLYKHGDFDGNYARFPEKALRIAILLASLSNQHRIEYCHWARAQQITERWRSHLHSLYEAVNQAEVTEAEQMEDKIVQVVTRLSWATARELSQYIRGLDTSSARGKAEELVRAGLFEKIKVGKTEKYAVAGSVDIQRLHVQAAQEAV